MWLPLTRPGLTIYEGHAGTVRMLENFAGVHGEAWMQFDEFTELPDGRVLACGQLVRSTDNGIFPVGERVNALFKLRHGLVIGPDNWPASAG